MSALATANVMTDEDADDLSTFIQFRCGQVFKAWVEKAARAKSLKPAAYIRMVLNDRMKADGIEPPAPPKKGRQ